MDEVTMLARNKKNDGDDNVIIDVVRGRSEVESEEKYQTKTSKTYVLASDTLDHGEESEEKKDICVKQTDSAVRSSASRISILFFVSSKHCHLIHFFLISFFIVRFF